jgi:S1-C subfamily serine protease
MSRQESRGAGLSRLSLLLAVAALTLLPLTSAAQRTRKQILSSAMPASVFVLSADFVNGKVVPVSSGSGTIVAADGSVITNYHVLNNKEKARLHDLFLIGRFRKPDQDPELVCAGRPLSGKLEPKLDLALVKCTVSLDGDPIEFDDWPAIKIGDSTTLIPGEKITIIGYPGIGGSTIHVTSGELSGWSGESGGAGRAFIKTDAQIAHGNSGGTALNEAGDYIGVPTAFRVFTEEIGGSVATSGNVGLIRPIEHAADLIATANKGWTPAEGDNAIGAPAKPETAEAKPTKPEAKAGGVQVHSKVVDSANGTAVRGAFVVVFKPDIKSGQIDVDKIEEQALTYGQTNARGEFELGARVPRGNTYTVAVVAEGFQPLIEDDVLAIDATTPDRFEPWEVIAIDRK